MIVVVAGQHRKVGKTTAMCDLIAATRDAQWVAIKISPHKHTDQIGHLRDTDRYLQAGAVSAHLIEATPPLDLPAARNLMLESNSIVRQLEPDVLFLVTDPGSDEWKPSALPLRQHPRTIRVDQRVRPEHINLLRTLCIE